MRVGEGDRRFGPFVGVVHLWGLTSYMCFLYTVFFYDFSYIFYIQNCTRSRFFITFRTFHVFKIEKLLGFGRFIFTILKNKNILMNCVSVRTMELRLPRSSAASRQLGSSSTNSAPKALGKKSHNLVCGMGS